MARFHFAQLPLTFCEAVGYIWDACPIAAAMRSFAPFLSWLLYAIGLLVSLSGIACWIYQGYLWLRQGTWISLPVGHFFVVDQTGWMGLDQVALIFLNTNIGYPLIAIGIVLMMASLRFGTR